MQTFSCLLFSIINLFRILFYQVVKCFFIQVSNDIHWGIIWLETVRKVNSRQQKSAHAGRELSHCSNICISYFHNQLNTLKDLYFEHESGTTH